MFTHPDLIGFSVKQHMDELMAEAEHERTLTAALRRRKAARAAAREARHQANLVASPAAMAFAPIASVKAANLRTPSVGAPRDRFAGDADPVAAPKRVSSDAAGNLSACEPRAAA